MPLLVKDVFDTAGVRSTAGSRLYADRVPRSWAGNLARPSPDTAVHLVLCPRLGVHEIPPGGVDELKIRVAFSAYTRAFSFLGWPAIAIGGVQFEARDETVLFAAGLAWERAYGPLD